MTRRRRGNEAPLLSSFRVQLVHSVLLETRVAAVSEGGAVELAKAIWYRDGAKAFEQTDELLEYIDADPVPLEAGL